MGKNTGYGNVYEIILTGGQYVYVCWIEKCAFGIFNYFSKMPARLDQLLPLGFKAYKDCKETAIKREIWKCIGHIDLGQENVKYPDLAIFMTYNRDLFIGQSRIMRNGNPIVVPQEYYLSLLKKGYIYGFFDNYKTFEDWMYNFLENYPSNYEQAW